MACTRAKNVLLSVRGAPIPSPHQPLKHLHRRRRLVLGTGSSERNGMVCQEKINHLHY